MPTGDPTRRRRDSNSRSLRPFSSKSTAKLKQPRDDGDSTEATPVKPDIDDLRKRRTSYYSAPVEERRRLSTKVSVVGLKARTKSKSSRPPTSAGKKRDSELDRKPRESRGEGGVSTRHNLSEEGLVYATTDPDELAGLGRASSSSNNSRLKRASSSSKHILEYDSVSEDDINPDDSISQVGLHPKPRRKPSTSSKTKPKRNTATPAKLTAIPEDTNAIPSRTSPSQRSHRRDSLLGGLLGRRNTTASSSPSIRLVGCLTCGADDVPSPKTAKLACGHRMCHECLKRVFEMSVKDPAHMPPKCCTKDHIPLKHVDKLFDVKFKMLWNRRYQEYHTRNRIYCPAPKCGEWIKPHHFQTYKGRQFAKCPRCRFKVCTQCNAKMHRSSDCPQDPAIAKLTEQAKEEGWQKCFSCKAMVELKEGCNHMTCRCTAEFCMVCGSKWKTCDCPWFNYRQLPDSDRLREMRVPEPIQALYRRVRDATGPPPNDAGARPRQPPTYHEELYQRGRQERQDAALARRLQLASLMEPADEDPPERRQRDVEAWGLAPNEGGHFLNDNFIQNAANVVMGAFGDTEFGRRGERASGRRRRAAREQPHARNGEASGLVPDFLGDASVLGARASR